MHRSWPRSQGIIGTNANRLPVHGIHVHEGGAPFERTQLHVRRWPCRLQGAPSRRAEPAAGACDLLRRRPPPASAAASGLGSLDGALTGLGIGMLLDGASESCGQCIGMVAGLGAGLTNSKVPRTIRQGEASFAPACVADVVATNRVRAANEMIRLFMG
jgi:hypothetical protein